MSAATDLAAVLDRIEQHDTDYAVRYGLILEAMYLAHRLGYWVGYGIDDKEDPELDGFRTVAYLQLPTGQLSWHMPEHAYPWDGHSTEQKYQRAREWSAANRG